MFQGAIGIRIDGTQNLVELRIDFCAENININDHYSIL